MAITENPLKVSEMAVSSKTSYNSASDDNLKSSLPSSSVLGDLSSITGMKSSYGVPQISNTNNIISSNITSYTNSICRSINNVWSDIANTIRTAGGLVSAVLCTVSTIYNLPSVISSQVYEAVNKIIRTQVSAIVRTANLTTSMIESISKQASTMFSSNSTLCGCTLRSRNNINSLASTSKYSTVLSTDTSYLLVATTQGAYINVVLENESSSGIGDTLTNYIDDIIDNPEERVNFLSGLMMSLSSNLSVDQTYRKLLIVLYLYDTGKLLDSDLMYLHMDVGIILENLNLEAEEEDTEYTNPVERMDNIIRALNIINPSWYKNDKHSDVYNYSITAGNTHMDTLSNKKLIDSYDEDINLTAKYTTTLNPEHHIAIVNLFHSAAT